MTSPSSPPSTDAAARPRRVVIVGAGFTGVSLAVQLVRRTRRPLAITLVDPSAQPGRGLAYQAPDPSHRLNAPTFVHTVLPEDITHFSRWCQARGLLQQDPEALAPDGAVYIRRHDFGQYLAETLAAHAQWPTADAADPDRCEAMDTANTANTANTLCSTAARRAHSTITPAQDLAVALDEQGVRTRDGRHLPADVVCLATGNALPRPPAPFDQPALRSHPALVAQPLGLPALPALQPGARVLVLGSGLTALDVLASLLRQGHVGEVLVLSRRGLRPRPQGPWPEALAQLMAQQPGLAGVSALPGGLMLARIQSPPPPFVAGPGVPATARHWLRALRQRIRQVQAEGATWHSPFDELRDTLAQTWPLLPTAEQRRLVRRLKPWYDVHRYRSPPSAEAAVNAAVADGRIRFVAARLVAAQPDPGGRIQVRWQAAGEAAGPCEGAFDLVVNCTGLDTAALAGNPLLASSLAQGRLQPDACGLGLAVDGQCRALDTQGRPQPALRVFGPPTLGSTGDAVGAFFIAAQIHRVMSGLLQDLTAEG